LSTRRALALSSAFGVSALFSVVALPAAHAVPHQAGPISCPSDDGGDGNTVARTRAMAVRDKAAARTPRALSDPGEENPACGPQAPGEYKALQDTSGGAGLPEHALLDAAAQADRIPSVHGLGGWVSQGPANIGGRVTGLAVNSNGDVFLGAAGGGVWKSTDHGATWKPTWGERMPQAIGAVAADGHGAIYVGTGEANPGGGSITYEGDGIYRSTDGGRHWRNLGLTTSATIAKIVVDPANPRRIWVAATGSLFRPGGEKGVYLSTDAGRHWKRVLAGADTWTGAVDVSLAPDRPGTVYAAMWERQRTPSLRRYGGPGSGVYRSTDGGRHWTRLENVKTLTPGDTTGLKPDASLSRIGIAAAPHGRLYVRTASWGASDEKGFYVSDDYGSTLTTGTEPQAFLGWWGGNVWVDPADGDHLFVDGELLRESRDGGKTWSDDDGEHVDHHAMAFDPTRPGRVYEGNDGGVYTSTANAATNTWTVASNMPWTQFYSVAVSEQDVTRLTGGTQDNGSNRTWGGARWNSWYGGDGEQNLIDPVNQNRVFACYQYGNCTRSLDGGDTTTDFTVAAASTDRFGWLAALEFADGNPSTLYLGGNRLFKSTDGVTFTPISPDLTGGPGDDPVYPFGTITTVWSARTDPSEIMVGTDDGRIQVSHDGGATWTLTHTGSQWVTRVRIDPTDARHAVATLSGYRNGTGGGHVLETRDAGKHWTDITRNLPDTPVNSVVFGPYGSLITGTDVGVFVTPRHGLPWLRLGRLPLAPIDDVKWQAASSTVVAATFGRGVYTLHLPARPF
jgi:hypothetical protein